MINAHLKFEAESLNSSKGVTFTKNYTKLKIKVKVTNFQNMMRNLDDQQLVHV